MTDVVTIKRVTFSPACPVTFFFKAFRWTGESGPRVTAIWLPDRAYLSVNSVGVLPVTWRNAYEKAGTLA